MAPVDRSHRSTSRNAILVVASLAVAESCFAQPQQTLPPLEPGSPTAPVQPARSEPAAPGREAWPLPWTADSLATIPTISAQPLARFMQCRPGLSDRAFHQLLARLRPSVDEVTHAALTSQWHACDQRVHERHQAEARRLLKRAEELGAIEASDPWTVSFMDKVMDEAEVGSRFADSTEAEAHALLDEVLAAREKSGTAGPGDLLAIARAKEAIVVARTGVAPMPRADVGVAFSPYAELPAELNDDAQRRLGESAARYVVEVTPHRQSLARGLTRAHAAIRFLVSNDEALQRRVRTSAASAFSEETVRTIRDRIQQSIWEIGSVLGAEVEARLQRQFERASFPEVDPPITAGETLDTLVKEKRAEAWKRFDEPLAPIQVEYASRLEQSATTLRRLSLELFFAQYHPSGAASMPEYNARSESLASTLAAHQNLVAEYRAAVAAIVPAAEWPEGQGAPPHESAR